METSDNAPPVAGLQETAPPLVQAKRRKDDSAASEPGGAEVFQVKPVASTAHTATQKVFV